MPDLDSSSASLVSSALRVAAGMTFAWSTTRPVSAGKLGAARAVAQASATIMSAAHASAKDARTENVRAENTRTHDAAGAPLPPSREAQRPAVICAPQTATRGSEL